MMMLKAGINAAIFAALWDLSKVVCMLPEPHNTTALPLARDISGWFPYFVVMYMIAHSGEAKETYSAWTASRRSPDGTTRTYVHVGRDKDQ